MRVIITSLFVLAILHHAEAKDYSKISGELRTVEGCKLVQLPNGRHFHSGQLEFYPEFKAPGTAAPMLKFKFETRPMLALPTERSLACDALEALVGLDSSIEVDQQGLVKSITLNLND